MWALHVRNVNRFSQSLRCMGVIIKVDQYLMRNEGPGGVLLKETPDL